MKKKTMAFTLAEVLITLSVIGIIAAITLPSLIVNINERAWESQKKALVARLSQAIPQLSTLSGYGTYTLGGETTDEDGNTTTTATEDTASETFIIDGLSKVYKVANICTSTDLSSCGLPDTIVPMNDGTEIDFPTSLSELNTVFTFNNELGGGDMYDTAAAAFETLNGESVAVYYNPACGSDNTTASHYVYNKMCVNFIYDLNGTKGPNQMGKDIGFVTVFYKSDPSVAGPIPYTSNASSTYPSYSDSGDDAASACKDISEDLRLPNRDEIASMFVNMRLMGITSGYYWSGSVISAGSSGLAWGQSFGHGSRYRSTRSLSYAVRCVRR